jgi:predicted nucleic acid-binding Zn ribbon protein
VTGMPPDDETRELPPEQSRPCPQCGNQVPAGAEFCPSCGANMRPKRSRTGPIVIAAIVALAAGVGIALLVSDNNGKSSDTVTTKVTSTVTNTTSNSITVQTPARTVTAPAATVPTATITVPAPTTTTP